MATTGSAGRVRRHRVADGMRRLLGPALPAPEQRRLVARFWRGARGFWSGRAARVSWSLAALLVAVVLLQLFVQYEINRWQRDFYDALDLRREGAIWREVARFFGLVLASTALALAVTWGRMTTQRHWRDALTRSLIAAWHAAAARRGRAIAAGAPPSPEYRVAEDANVATQLPVDFAIGLLSAALSAATFIGVLWSVGGDLTIPLPGGFIEIPGYLVIAAVLYAMGSTAAMLWVGRRLVPVIEAKNQAEAELRAAGTGLREASEGLRPPPVPGDGAAVAGALARVTAAWRLMCEQLMRTLFISHGSALLAPLIALTLSVPKYLDGELSLGEVMQLAAAFVIVQTAFNWLVDNYPRIAEWLSAVDRVALLMMWLEDEEAG